MSSALNCVLTTAQSVKTLQASSEEAMYLFYKGVLKRAVKNLMFKEAEVIKQYIDETYKLKKSIIASLIVADYDKKKYPVVVDVAAKGSKDLFGFVKGSLDKLGILISSKSEGDTFQAVVALSRDDKDILVKKLKDQSNFKITVRE